MTNRSRLKRNSDGKIFVPVLTKSMEFISHWSDIVDMDRTETDRIKWLGGCEYVSASKGHVYTLQE